MLLHYLHLYLFQLSFVFANGMALFPLKGALQIQNQFGGTFEASLILHYKMVCKPTWNQKNPIPRVMSGSVTYGQKRKILFFLPYTDAEWEVPLGILDGQDSKSVSYEIQRNDRCLLFQIPLKPHVSLNYVDFLNQKVSSQNPKPSEWKWIAKKFQPFIIPMESKSDSLGNCKSDCLLARGFDVQSLGENGLYHIRYSEFFSDEDSMRSQIDTSNQMNKYGRRSDIEWSIQGMIQIEKDLIPRWKDGTIIYQGILHLSLPFSKSDFLWGTSHPVLRVFMKNNVFLATGNANSSGFFVTSSPVPRMQFQFPQARESLLFQNPWLIEFSDYELSIEKKLEQSFQKYLYVKISAEVKSGKYTPQIEFTDQWGNYHSKIFDEKIKNHGKNLYEIENYTAFSLADEEYELFQSNQIRDLTVRFHKRGLWHLRLIPFAHTSVFIFNENIFGKIQIQSLPENQIQTEWP